MTTFMRLIARVVRALVRVTEWAFVGAGIAAVVGIWTGLWFGAYQVLRHDDLARFWPVFSSCIAWAAVSGALTGCLAFFADGANPFTRSHETESLADTLVNQRATRLPASLAARMRLPLTRVGTKIGEQP